MVADPESETEILPDKLDESELESEGEADLVADTDTEGEALMEILAVGETLWDGD